MKTYIVQGETGEHADKTIWPVCAHRTLEGAHVKKKMFEVWAELNSVDQNDEKFNLAHDRLEKAQLTWKQAFPQYILQLDYNGVLWDVIELEYDPDEQIPGTGVV